MTSATTNRPAGAMTSAARSTRFGDFSSAPGRHNSEDRIPQASGLGQTFGNGASWQASSGIWGSNNISSGFTKRDASRSRAAGRSAQRGEMLAVTDGPVAADNDSFPDGPSGSGALAASSEADPWSGRTNGPWNAPDTTSPILHNSGNTSPTRVRTNMPAASQQTLLELQSPYSSSRPAIGQGKSFSRSQPKSNLDPSSGSFSYSRKPSFGYVDADKENYNQDSPYSGEAPRTFRPDQIGSQNSSYLAISGAGSRDASMPTSRASEPTLSFGNTKGYGHTPASSIHSQRPSFSGVSGSFHQSSSSRYGNDIAAQVQEAGARDKFSSGLGLRSVEQIGSVSQEYSVSPSHSNFDPQSYQSNGGALWNDNSKGFSPYAPEFNPPFAEQAYFNGRGMPRFGDRGSISPAGSDYRRGVESPKFYSATGTPSSDQVYRPGSRGPRIPPGPAELNQRLQNIHIGHPQAIFYTGGYQGQYPPPPYDYQPTTFRASNMPYGYPIPIPPFPSAPVIPTRPAKEQDIGAGVRSVLLEEFRSNAKSNKRYDLKDIYNHVVEFSGDQHGSRFIQQKLETANSDEKEQIFREIQPNALQLMTDVFGNYVIQKMFEHGNQVQKRVLAEQLKNHVNEMSLQMYGCRVVQKALEHVLADQQAELVKELHADVLKCVKDQNGNHVVQKAIERVPREHIQFIIDAFKTQVHILAAHPYGCRVIQRILEYCTAADQALILEELHQCANMLITDQYGNYVIQHVIAHGKPEDRAKLIKIVTTQVLPLSKHKFASNVVEKSIQYGTDEQRKAIVAQMTMMHSDGTTPLQLMMKDQYANYVIQKLLAQLKGEERDAFIEDMKPQLISLKKFSYGKQIAAIEKLIFVTPQPYMAPTSPLTEDLMKRNIPVERDQLGSQQTQTQPIEIGSSAPTPSLTMGQNSPQSSSLPSTNVSTVDGPTDGSTDSDKTYTNDQGCPEVVINGV